MTYCVGILVREGLVMIGDTRTNVGVDNIATFRKLQLFETPGERAIGFASAGNLSVAQSVLSIVTEGFRNPDTGETERLLGADTMFGAAQLVGRAVREGRLGGLPKEQAEFGSLRRDHPSRRPGQGRAPPPVHDLLGNFIEATADTPYLQIGEHKYGKPILDRSVVEHHQPRRRAEARADLDGLDHPVQPQRRATDRRIVIRRDSLNSDGDLSGSTQAGPISTTSASTGPPRSAPPTRRSRRRPIRRGSTPFPRSGYSCPMPAEPVAFGPFLLRSRQRNALP